MAGYIKDHRKELDSDIWAMPPLYHRVWQYLKYKVNHEAAEIPMRDGSRFRLDPGQHLTSIRAIAKGIGWYEGRLWKEPNPKTIDTILKWLEKMGMIAVDRDRGNNGYTLVSLVNWVIYQHDNVSGNSKVTAEKQSMDINNNNKEFITTTAAWDEHADESQNLAPESDRHPIRDLEAAYFNLHGKVFSAIETGLAMNLLNQGIPAAFLAERMRAKYAEKTAANETVSSFKYYVNYMQDAWNKELVITGAVPPVLVALDRVTTSVPTGGVALAKDPITDAVPPVSVALGKARKSRQQLQSDQLLREIMEAESHDRNGTQENFFDHHQHVQRIQL